MGRLSANNCFSCSQLRKKAEREGECEGGGGGWGGFGGGQRGGVWEELSLHMVVLAGQYKQWPGVLKSIGFFSQTIHAPLRTVYGHHRNRDEMNTGTERLIRSIKG